MNARRPLHKTSKPISSVLSSVLRAAASASRHREEILDAIPEEEFIADYLLLAIQDGLAGDEPKALRRLGTKRWLCTRSGHSQWIG